MLKKLRRTKLCVCVLLFMGISGFAGPISRAETLQVPIGLDYTQGWFTQLGQDQGMDYFYLRAEQRQIDGVSHGELSTGSGSDQATLKVKRDLSGSTWITAKLFEKESKDWVDRYNKLQSQIVKGVAYKEVPYVQTGRDVFINKIKVHTLPKDTGTPETGVCYAMSKAYEIKTPDKRLFYYILQSDNIPHINKVETNYLVEVKAGKLASSTVVYGGLAYLKNGQWRSSYPFGDGTEHVWLHTPGKASVWMPDFLKKSVIKKKMMPTGGEYKIVLLGSNKDHLVYSVVSQNREGGTLNPVVKFLDVDGMNRVTLRPETTKSELFEFEGKWMSGNHIYVLQQDGQVVRDLTSGKTLDLEGDKTNLGRFTLAKSRAFGGKLPKYHYRGKTYVCLEDLKLLGYTMKWDAKEHLGRWLYTGKSAGKAHVFKTRVIKDNDVFATIEGKVFHIYNAEGYSLVDLDALSQLERLSKP